MLPFPYFLVTTILTSKRLQKHRTVAAVKQSEEATKENKKQMGRLSFQCFRYGGGPYLIRDSSEPPRLNVICYLCKELVHIARNCSQGNRTGEIDVTPLLEQWCSTNLYQ